MNDQFEIEGTESQERDPELHALGLELYDLQQQRMQLTKDEKAKRAEIGAALHERKMDLYHVDGVKLYIDKTEKVKVSMDSDDGDDDE